MPLLQRKVLFFPLSLQQSWKRLCLIVFANLAVLVRLHPQECCCSLLGDKDRRPPLETMVLAPVSLCLSTTSHSKCQQTNKQITITPYGRKSGWAAKYLCYAHIALLHTAEHSMEARTGQRSAFSSNSSSGVVSKLPLCHTPLPPLIGHLNPDHLFLYVSHSADSCSSPILSSLPSLLRPVASVYTVPIILACQRPDTLPNTLHRHTIKR